MVAPLTDWIFARPILTLPYASPTRLFATGILTVTVGVLRAGEYKDDGS